MAEIAICSDRNVCSSYKAGKLSDLIVRQQLTFVNYVRT